MTNQKILAVTSFVLTALTMVSCGGGGGGKSSAGGVGGSTSPTSSLVLLAGDIGGPGNIDGTGTAARFVSPYTLTVDPSGNVFVADGDINTIRKITPSGVVSTFAGAVGVSGSNDGIGGAARFSDPGGVASDASGNIYVVDSGNNIIRKITPSGVVSTLAGLAGQTGTTDGAGGNARFNGPWGITVDAAGTLYVTDQINQTVRVIDPLGNVATLAGDASVIGAANGIGINAQFNYPTGIATDATYLYIADTNNHRIRRIDIATAEVTTLAGSTGGYLDGAGAFAQFYQPQGVVSDAAGNVFVADSGNHVIRAITAAGVVTTPDGTANTQGSTNGVGASARFNYPYDIARDAAGNLYVAEGGNYDIRKISPATEVTTLAGAAAQFGRVDAQGASARFTNLLSIAADSAGNAYIGDGLLLRKSDPTGNVTTVLASGAFSAYGMARDNLGNLYIADADNHVIRKVDTTLNVSTYAGSIGNRGSSNGQALTFARFDSPKGIAFDSISGNFYVADSGNHTIRVITPAGDVTTLAGTAGVPGRNDGTGIGAQFRFPSDLVCDSSGTIFVADGANASIRKIIASGPASGEVSTFAGSATRGTADGVGGAAQFSILSGIGIDSTDNLYVADTGNNLIRKITPAAVVTTVVGAPGKVGVQLGALPASLFSPRDIAVRPDGELLIVTPNGIVVTQGF